MYNILNYCDIPHFLVRDHLKSTSGLSYQYNLHHLLMILVKKYKKLMTVYCSLLSEIFFRHALVRAFSKQAIIN